MMLKKLLVFPLTLICLGNSAFAQNSPTAPTTPQARVMLDMNNADDVVKSDRKLQSSLKDGEEVVYYWEGNVYTRIAGEKDRHLFHYWGMNVRASKGFTDPVKGYGYRLVTREVLFYLDPKTNEVVRTWKNPWTDEEVDVVHITNDPVNAPISWARGERGAARTMWAALIRRWRFSISLPTRMSYLMPRKTWPTRLFHGHGFQNCCRG